jgi:hypothetical protein
VLGNELQAFQAAAPAMSFSGLLKMQAHRIPPESSLLDRYLL